MNACLKWLIVGLQFVAMGICAAADVQATQPLDVVRRMADAGAIDTALERINQGQPPQASAAGWSDWELLRLELLARRHRDAELMKRVAVVRNIALADKSAAQLWLLAARAASRLGQSVDARDHYARYFLRAELGTVEYREARLGVIETYLADKNADEAYRSMLRYQQDFAPLRADEAERFVSALVLLGRAQDAATWLPQLDKASPAAALLRLRAGLITADAAVAQARALLVKGSAAEPALALLAAAAVAQKSSAIEIEVLEIRLQSMRTGEDKAALEGSAALWKRYQEVGPQAANQAQLLVGEDNAWIDRAEKISASQPQLARALLGHVVTQGRSDEARARAQIVMITALRDARLPLAALRLYADPQRFPLSSLDARVRHLLGGVAAENKSPAEAVRYWQKLSPPAGSAAQEFQVRYLAALFQAGMVDAGIETAKALIGSARQLPPELVGRLSAIASDALDVWHVKPAQALYAMLLPLSTGPERVEVLVGLGRTRELTGDFRLAADAFLNAAALATAPETDRVALRARESGAINLAKAGLLEDARATYRWLADHAKDASIRDAALRALRSL